MSQQKQPRWHTQCAAYKLLINDIMSGKVTEDMKPMHVWESRPEYREYRIDCFRSNLKRAFRRCDTKSDTEGMFILLTIATMFLTSQIFF